MAMNQGGGLSLSSTVADSTRPVSAGNIKALFPDSADVQYYWTGTQPVTLGFFNGSSAIVNVSSGAVYYQNSIAVTARQFVAGEVIMTPQVGFEPVSVTTAYVSQAMSNSVRLGQMNLSWNGSAFVVASDWTETRLVTNLSGLTIQYTCNQQPPNMTGDEVVTYKMLKQLI